MKDFKPYKDRTLDTKKPIFVYRNLTRKCLSIVQNGLVVGYVSSVIIGDVTFHISPSKYKEFLRTKQKNVHSKARGFIIEGHETDNPLERIQYNPLVAPYFRYGTEGKERIDKTKSLEIHYNGFMQATI